VSEHSNLPNFKKEGVGGVRLLLYNSSGMERERFEKLLLNAVDNLPREFQEKLDNVDIIIDDLPSARQTKKLRLRQGSDLLGLYEGVPQTVRGQSYNLVLPDKITLFQKSIESICSSDKEIEAEITNTLKHEIAHHFGISDDTLRKIERKQRGKRK
jgi:predicted Zn-dependent protease with MMP-like domain